MKHNRYSAKQIDPKIESASSPIERSMARSAQVTSYLFHAPDPYKSAALIFILSLFAGFILNFNIINFGANFSIRNIYDNAIIYGLIVIGFPALISGLISTPLAELLGGTLYYKRSFLLAFISCVILFVVLIIGKILHGIFEFNFVVVFIFGYALIFSVRHSVFLATSHPKNLNSIFGSINQTLLGYFFLWLIPTTGKYIANQELLYMFWFVVIFFITTTLWIRIITTPFRRNFNVDGLLLMKHALSQFTKDYREGKALEKDFFAKIGSKSDLRVGVISIKEKLSTKKPPIKTLMVIPSVHPGPFGILGGSNLPSKLLKYLKNLTTNLMVFHGPAGHAQNPVATDECVKIAKKVQTLVAETKYSEDVSKFHRVASSDEKNIGKTASNKSTLTLCAQRFGNGIMYIHTSSPEPTDDIDNPTGEAIIQKGEAETGLKSLFADAHNCLEPGTGEVFFGSEKANNMLELISKLNNKLKNGSDYILQTGFADDRSFNVTDGFGPMGIQVLVLKCEPKNKNLKNEDSKFYAYILLDGNNVIRGLREQILEAISYLVDDAEVFTTDNHIVNATMGGYNPIGLKAESQRIKISVGKLIKEAKKNLTPSVVGLNSGIVKNIRILGKNMPMRLSTTINSTIAIMKNSLVACQALALSVCWLVTLI